MEPDDFLSQSAYEALTEEEQLAYIERVRGEWDRAQSGEDNGRTLQFTIHYGDIAHWVLPEEEYERLYRGPVWEGIWENAEAMRDALEDLSADPELSDEARTEAAGRLPDLDAIVEHKRALGDLPGTEPSGSEEG